MLESQSAAVVSVEVFDLLHTWRRGAPAESAAAGTRLYSLALGPAADPQAGYARTALESAGVHVVSVGPDQWSLRWYPRPARAAPDGLVTGAPAEVCRINPGNVGCQE